MKPAALLKKALSFPFILPTLHLALHHAFVPLHSHLLRIRPAGPSQVRPPEGRLARPQAHRPVPSVGRSRVRSRSIKYFLSHCFFYSES